MQYLLMIYQAEEIWENMSDAQRREVLAGHARLNEELQARNVQYSGEPLMPTTTSVSVRTTPDQSITTDGPFAETKEQLAGFYLVDVASVEEAVEIAQKIPVTMSGTVEVRPLADHSEYL